MTYRRPPGAQQADLAASKEFENEVRRALPDYVHVRTDSSVDLDFYIPPVVVEVKEKRQKLNIRWWGEFEPGGSEENLFVIDELTVRKALKHWPYVWFVLRDVPMERIFLASIAEVLSADRHRFDRGGKGKWVLQTVQFRTLTLDFVMDEIRTEIEQEVWKQSGCVLPAPQV